MKRPTVQDARRQSDSFGLRTAGAFSLVEIVLALGVASFAILTVVALLPLGMRTTRDTLEESNAVNLLSGMIANRLATPLTQTSIITNSSATADSPTVYVLPALISNGNAVPPASPAPTVATSPFGIMDNNQVSANLFKSHYRVDYAFTPPAAGTLVPYTGYFKVSWPADSTIPANFVEVTVTFPQP